MTVLDQLRAAAALDERVTELVAAAVHARDVLTSDLTGEDLYEALESVVDHLQRVTGSGSSTLNEGAETGSPSSSKDASRRNVAQKSRKSAKKTASKAARRSRPSPGDATAGKATKRCPTCDTIKPVAEFNKNRSTKDGLQTRCRDCQRAHARKDAHSSTQQAQRPVRDSGQGAGSTPQRPATKVCEHCNHHKPRGAFDPLVTAKDGLQKWCRECLRHALDRPESGNGKPDSHISQTTLTDDLVAVCPTHSVVARTPRNEVTVPPEAWLFTARSNHRLDTRCEQQLELREGAAA